MAWQKTKFKKVWHTLIVLKIQINNEFSDNNVVGNSGKKGSDLPQSSYYTSGSK